MNYKKIKNYLILALIIFSGLITLYNNFLGEDSDMQEDQLVLVESGQATSGDQVEVASDETQVVSESLGLQYEQALESIKGFEAIRDVQWLEDQDSHVRASYQQYADQGWQGLVQGQASGTKAGGRWMNYDDQLPEFGLDGQAITYQEFDVNDKIQGRSRDAERFVVGSDTSVYYTEDHYDSFIKIIQ